MKRFMFMCMMLLAATLTFTACGSDDDEDINNGEVITDNLYTYSESTTIPSYGRITVIGSAAFDNNNKCTSITIQHVYEKKSFAKQIWKAYLEEAEENKDWAEAMQYYSFDGNNTITYQIPGNVVRQYAAAMTKDQLCEQVKQMVISNIENYNAIYSEE